ICSEREARVHYTEMKDDEVRTLRLCEQCAEARGFTKMEKKPEFSLPDLLAGMAEDKFAGTEAEAAPLTCERCGLTYPEFKKTGRLGCGECYEAFAAPLLPLLKRIHGSENHVGKVPRRLRGQERMPPREPREQQKPQKSLKAPEDRLEDLRRQLDRCVDAEDFEQAASIRDRIRRLEESRGT
ncbi:MAG: hypothetical protein HKN20_17800, partial [Gemmatimonadetes bacterium]|nr:hypothetical protein [Gemmatimonadota bacterium]